MGINVGNSKLPIRALQTRTRRFYDNDSRGCAVCQRTLSSIVCHEGAYWPI